MSIVPPLLAATGNGVPSFLLNMIPESPPFTALLGSVFLYNMPHMWRMHLTSKAAGGISKIKNENPRAQKEEMTKHPVYGEAIVRAEAAHQNGLESFPVFAAGILGATMMGVDKATVGKLASFHLLCRAAFNVLYMGFNTPGPSNGRTLAWFLSLLSSCQLIALAASK
mmetsp:Transcript_15680/g.37224  ORF Transcript_15680/g.37224 Transcript_15680/m.37224 type:complete len:168 (-) Transcript_15680:141-644(-)